MTIELTPLQGLVIINPTVFTDERGFFMEVYRKDEFAASKITETFIQENHSSSQKGVLRGLHFQWDKPLGKLIRVISGSAFAVAVDIRKKSPTLGKWFSIALSYENKKAIFVPPGFASGFCALTDPVDVEYQYTALYNKHGESSILWNDPSIGIRWPITHPMLSPRDAQASSFESWLARPESNFW